MKHLRLYEEFKEGPMRKDPSIFQKMYKGAKDFMGIESSEDRERYEDVVRMITMNDSYGLKQSIREIKPGVVVMWLNDQSLTIDTITPEIIWRGNILDLKDTEESANYLYSRIKDYINTPQMTQGLRR